MTKQAHKGKILLVFMSLILALAVLSGTGGAANSSPEELSERGTVIDFEGAAGTIVDSLSAGKGMVGDVAGGSVKVSGYTQEIGMDTNVAMIFDEDTLRKLNQLTLVAGRIRAGVLKGERRSTKRGTSIEFADYRN